MADDEHLVGWWAALDVATRQEWLDLGAVGASDVAPPELGSSLRAAVAGEPLQTAWFAGWLVPAHVLRSLQERRAERA